MRLPAPSDGWRAFVLILAMLGAAGVALEFGWLKWGEFGAGVLVGAIAVLMVLIGVFE